MIQILHDVQNNPSNGRRIVPPPPIERRTALGPVKMIKVKETTINIEVPFLTDLINAQFVGSQLFHVLFHFAIKNL